MIPIRAHVGRPVAVFGLGRSGMATVRALMQGGAEVWAWDDSAERRGEAAASGAPIIDLGGCDWSKPAALVLSPGIPHRFPTPHPIAAAARAAGCEIIGDIELLARAVPQATFVGVTGTNGKSTTTTLIGHILNSAGRRVEMGGNLGPAALALAPLRSGEIYLLEMSSYQLELAPSIAFAVAVLLNVTPDHIDRHGSFAGYLAAKKRIFAQLAAGGTAIIGVDDDTCRSLASELTAAGRRVLPISAERALPGGVHARNGRLCDHISGELRPVLDLRSVPTLPGAHNWQNAAAAYAACRTLGLDAAIIAAGIARYPGLAHRQELIATIGGIRFVNDSKATNADAAGKALCCYDTIYWILGGRPKSGGLAGLEGYFARIRHAFLIGEAAAAFADTLMGRVPFSLAGTLDSAVRAAYAMAAAERRADAVVLLSPACASFDQFANFEERGLAFRRLVEALPHSPESRAAGSSAGAAA